MNCKTIVNFHVIDPKNIGDRLSSPLHYFKFPGFDTQTFDIRHLDRVDPQFIKESHILIGGGGLIYSRFQEFFKTITQKKRSGKLIAWGVGQQNYTLNPLDPCLDFDYDSYIHAFNLIGIRDYGQSLPWVPCASCMHPAFDRDREIKHDLVVFSHKKFQIHLPGVPRLTNITQNFDHILDFLASGETILTSSYHGAYWGTLLGRKVLAFPFSSKFYTFKHLPTLYPVKKWNQEGWKVSFFNKTLYQYWRKNNFSCDIENWQALLKDGQAYPESLMECRTQNQRFYQRCREMLEKL